jgi:hypothetical protein
MTALSRRITAAAGGIVVATIIAVTAPAMGARYGERIAIEEMMPVLIEQPVPPKTGLGIILLKIAMGSRGN